MNKSRVTLRDVAKAADLAVSTVSQALREEGTVSRKTCRRIQELARQMGYIPNPVIAAMASKRGSSDKSHTAPLAWIISYDGPFKVGPYPIAVERARALGYQIEGFQMKKGREKELGHMLYARGFVGVILDVLYGHDHLPDFPWEQFSVIKRGRDFFPVPFHTVRHSTFDEIQLIWNQIRSRGYKRIGVILFKHPVNHPDDIARHGAVLQAQSCLGADETAIEPLHCILTNERDVIPKWFRRHRPDAVLGFHIGEFFALSEAGIPVGKNIGFATMNINTPEQYPHISGMLDSIPYQLERAVDLTDLQIRHHISGPVETPTSTLLTPRWHEGTTLRGI